MIQRILQVAFLVILAGLLIVQGLSATAAGQPAMVAVQVDDAACTSGYALWANGQGIFNVLEWPASRLNVQGKVRSNWAIHLHGSFNVIEDTVEYVASFDDHGDDNDYPAPVQTAAAEMPVAFDIDDYRPGGSAAAAADQAGRYHYVSGDLRIDDDDDDDDVDDDDDEELEDGLYYVTGDVEIRRDNLSAQVTIVARGDIEIRSSELALSAYSGGLLLFSNAVLNRGDAIKISGHDSLFQGLVYAPGGRLDVGGSNNEFQGGLFARTIRLHGSSSTIADEDSYCQPALTPTPPPTATVDPAPTATSTPPSGPGPGANPLFLPLARVLGNGHAGEPNNACGQAHYISPGVTLAYLAEDSQDWYTFELPSGGDVAVELRDFVPLEGQIAAYRGESCSATTFIANNGDSTVDKMLNLGPQPAGRYYLFVGNDGPLNNNDYYSLTIVVR